MQKHFTATTYIIKEKKTLLVFHKKVKKWLPPGGHLEENETPVECAKREALEETGLEVEIIPQENLWLNYSNAVSIERPYLCLLENIPAHGTSAEHKHIDFIYVSRPISGKEHTLEENVEQLQWFGIDDLDKLIPEEDIYEETLQTIRHIFSKFT